MFCSQEASPRLQHGNFPQQLGRPGSGAVLLSFFRREVRDTLCRQQVCFFSRRKFWSIFFGKLYHLPSSQCKATSNHFLPGRSFLEDFARVERAAIEKFSVRGLNHEPFPLQAPSCRLESTLRCSGSTATLLQPFQHRSFHFVPGRCNLTGDRPSLWRE